MPPDHNTEIFERLRTLENVQAGCEQWKKNVDDMIQEIRDLKRFFIKLTLGALVSGSGLGAAVTGIIAAIQGG